MKLLKLSTLLVSAFFATTTFAAPSNVIVFGDSLSDAGMNTSFATGDVGNNAWVPTSGKIGAPITSLDATTNTHPLWINDFLAIILPGAVLYPSSQAASPYNNNIDYAYASAETNAHFLNDLSSNAYPPYVGTADGCTGPGQVSPTLSCVPGVLSQINTYLSAVQNKPNPNTLFILWAGGNDIFNNIAKLMSGLKTANNGYNYPEMSKQAQAAVELNPTTATSAELSTPIRNLLEAKDTLVAAGVNVNNIYVINLPDISRTPAANALTNGNKTILGILSAVSQSYNNNLLSALSENIFDQHNLPKNHVLSAYDWFNDILNNPAKYNLTNTTDSCVTDKQDPLCNGFVFFNDKHPTVAVGEIIGQNVAAAINAK